VRCAGHARCDDGAEAGGAAAGVTRAVAAAGWAGGGWPLAGLFVAQMALRLLHRGSKEIKSACASHAPLLRLHHRFTWLLMLTLLSRLPSCPPVQERVARVGGSMARLVHCKAALLLQTDVRQSATRAGIWRAQQCLQVRARVVQHAASGVITAAGLHTAHALDCEVPGPSAVWISLIRSAALPVARLPNTNQSDTKTPSLHCATQEWERLRALGMTAALGEDDALDLQVHCVRPCVWSVVATSCSRHASAAISLQCGCSSCPRLAWGATVSSCTQPLAHCVPPRLLNHPAFPS